MSSQGQWRSGGSAWQNREGGPAAEGEAGARDPEGWQAQSRPGEPPAAPAYGVPGPAYARDPGELTSEVRNLAMAVHLVAFAGIIIPLGNIIGPLVMWLTQRQKHPFIDEAGKQALNFNISITIYAFVSAIAILIVIGFFFLFAVAIAWIVFVIMAAIRTNNGDSYEYPLAIPFLR